MRNPYDPPLNSGVPSPLGPRLHNWKGGSLNQGNLFHGPVYTRPDYLMPYKSRPLDVPYKSTYYGFGEVSEVEEQTNNSSSLGVILPLVVLGGFLVALFAVSKD